MNQNPTPQAAIERDQRQAAACRQAAAEEQAAAETLRARGQEASAWAAAACAMDLRRQATILEQAAQDAQAQMEEDLDVLAGMAADAVARMASLAGGGIQDVFDAIEADAQARLDRSFQTLTERLMS